jgi:hypothetical protein
MIAPAAVGCLKAKPSSMCVNEIVVGAKLGATTHIHRSTSAYFQ